MSQDDVERLRQGYEDFNRGDYAAIFALLDEGFFVQDREEVPDPQTWRGMDGALRAFQSVGSDFEDYVIEPVEFVDGDGWVVVVVHQRGRGKASGAPVEGELCHLWRLRDGRATELRAFTTREEALAAAARDTGWPSS